MKVPRNREKLRNFKMLNFKIDNVEYYKVYSPVHFPLMQHQNQRVKSEVRHQFWELAGKNGYKTIRISILLSLIPL